MRQKNKKQISLFLHEMLPLPFVEGNYFRPFVGNGGGGGNLVRLSDVKVLPAWLNMPAIMG